MQKETYMDIETAEFVPGNSELTSLCIQLQQAIRSRNYPLFVTYIWSPIGLPGPLAQTNDEIDHY